YDYLCLKDALTQGYDLIYEAGYHSVAPSYAILNIKDKARPLIITNMDGLEWMRSKWNYLTRKLIRKLETIAVNNSHFLISDNLGIQLYYQNTFNKESFFIPYGADLIDEFRPEDLQSTGLVPYGYYLLIARLEPENNIEMILDGYVQSTKILPICIIGNTNSRYGQYLVNKYKDIDIRFLGAIYNKPLLDSLRHFSQIYFHGHSVGGTNPSLLEAMACNCFIVAHDNQFNKSVLQENALYFLDYRNIKVILEQEKTLRSAHFNPFTQGNETKIKNIYNWDSVVTQHELLFEKLIATQRLRS
ncbi:MAG TPA: DUF1972 domain-containing protein, partial [Flavitalea sp.]|nr:DUF1972 domain-containing protein [Flavitalea sp.]